MGLNIARNLLYSVTILNRANAPNRSAQHVLSPVPGPHDLGESGSFQTDPLPENWGAVRRIRWTSLAPTPARLRRRTALTCAPEAGYSPGRGYVSTRHRLGSATCLAISGTTRPAAARPGRSRKRN